MCTAAIGAWRAEDTDDGYLCGVSWRGMNYERQKHSSIKTTPQESLFWLHFTFAL